MKHKIPHTLPDGQSIFIFPLPYFLASKFEAYNARGMSDIRLSQDMEDILAVLDGNLEAKKIVNSSPSHVAEFLRNDFKVLLKKKALLEEAAEGFLRAGGEPLDRVMNVVKLIEDLCG